MSKLQQKDLHEAGTSYQFIDSLKMGPWTSYSVLHDPIHTAFVLSRYKFCARMLAGKDRVLEVGCGDAPGTPIVAEFVKQVVAIDWEPRLITSDKERLSQIKNIDFRVLDICKELPEGKFDAAFAIDVIEHLDKPVDKIFMSNIVKTLTPDGICIMGTPNKTANKYASPQSKIQHINLQTHQGLRKKMQRYFRNVFMFSMNDEMVHTGYGPMSHYLFGMGVGVR